jgi:chromosome segregation ATPase
MVEEKNQDWEPRMESMEKKISKFSEILQKFGLDLIQTIGGLSHDVGVLSAKIENIDKSIIEIKGIKTQLHETIKIQREWQKEITDIKTSIRSLNQKFGTSLAYPEDKQSQYSKLNETPLDVLDKFKEEITMAREVYSIQTAIKNAKERIFILTGGHKILIELRAYEQNARRNSNINFKSFQNTIIDKIREWKTYFSG